jgi:hypothetical protein
MEGDIWDVNDLQTDLSRQLSGSNSLLKMPFEKKLVFCYQRIVYILEKICVKYGLHNVNMVASVIYRKTVQKGG